MLRRLVVALVVLASAATASVPLGAAAALGDGALQDPAAGPPQLASSVPLLGTPHVMDGAVLGMTQVGDEIVAVGSFTRVSPAATFHETDDDLTRHGIFAFDARTGEIDRSFEVSLGGGPAAAIDTDGTSLFVGGDFRSVDGDRRQRRLVKLTSSGAVDPGFRVQTDAPVETLAVHGTRVYVGGAFRSIGTKRHHVSRRGLAAVSTTDGTVLSSVRVPFRGVYTTRFGETTIKRIDVTADGDRLVAIGNFTKAGRHPRAQVAVLDTSGARASVTGWHTDRFSPRRNSCNPHFGSFVRDVAFAPDGAWFVVATTGGFGGGARTATMCDTTSRWSTTRGRRPAWVSYTGGDTTTAVEVARGAVYVGGHMRWENNPYRGNRPGPGAVRREGIAALDPVTGLPLSWDPGRARGVGVQAFLPTADGLWVGSDTTLIAEQRRGRIALMSWDGGRPLPQTVRARLPNELFIAPRRGSGDLQRRDLDETGEPTGSPSTVSTGLSWETVRGATFIDGEVYYGRAGGGLFHRAFDPATGRTGPRHEVDTRGLPFPSERLTGLFYEPVRHRLYYTVEGASGLRYRDFSFESGVLGAVLHVSGGDHVDFADAAGVTLAGDRLLYGSRDGALRSVAFRGGRVRGEPHVISDDGTWRTRALFVPQP